MSAGAAHELATAKGPLRRAGPADLAAITALQRAAYARNRPLLGVEPLPLLADYALVLAHPGKETWLVRRDGRLVAVLVLEIRADDLLIESIASDPAAQGQGLGRLLLEAAMARARALGRPVLRLYTGTPLGHLIAWYGRHGFVVERVEALPDRSLTHMVRRLTDHQQEP